MAVTHETGLSPQAQDPRGGDQATWSQSPQVVPHRSPEQRRPAAPSERWELLEIAKANAAKALGTENIVLPASLRVCSLCEETNGGKCRSEDSAESTEQSRRLTDDLTKSGTESALTMKGLSFSPNNTRVKPASLC